MSKRHGWNYTDILRRSWKGVVLHRGHRGLMILVIVSENTLLRASVGDP
jgi:hypothetical protein